MSCGNCSKGQATQKELTKMSELCPCYLDSASQTAPSTRPALAVDSLWFRLPRAFHITWIPDLSALSYGFKILPPFRLYPDFSVGQSCCPSPRTPLPLLLLDHGEIMVSHLVWKGGQCHRHCNITDALYELQSVAETGKVTLCMELCVSGQN